LLLLAYEPAISAFRITTRKRSFGTTPSSSSLSQGPRYRRNRQRLSRRKADRSVDCRSSRLTSFSAHGSSGRLRYWPHALFVGLVEAAWGIKVLRGAGDRLLLASLVDHTNRLGARTVCRSGQGLMSAPALAGQLGNSDCGPGRCADGRDGASTRWRQLSGQADSRRRSERLRLLRERDGQRV
jgi:hypothetical protein